MPCSSCSHLNSTGKNIHIYLYQYLWKTLLPFRQYWSPNFVFLNTTCDCMLNFGKCTLWYPRETTRNGIICGLLSWQKLNRTISIDFLLRHNWWIKRVLHGFKPGKGEMWWFWLVPNVYEQAAKSSVNMLLRKLYVYKLTHCWLVKSNPQEGSDLIFHTK